MKLAGEEPIVRRQLDDFDKAVRAAAGDAQTQCLKAFDITLVHLVAMPVPFANALGAVELAHQ